MAQTSPPGGIEPPSGKRIALSALIACIVAGIVLVTAVLPAEYGIDPTGVGRAFGFTALRAPVRTIEITDVVGGNESVREVEIPDFGEPVPLPNPAVHQAEDQAPRSQRFVVAIPPEGETEIKTVLREGKMILYTWSVDRGTIYSDLHGHNPEFGSDFFVRYMEHCGAESDFDENGSCKVGSQQSGSLVAPFDGEHGWYWVNYNEFPVTVTLDVTGFYDDTIDYGIFDR
jgi:hypothetical protein